MIAKYYILLTLFLPTLMQAQVEKLSPTRFWVNADSIHSDSAALLFAKGDTLYLKSDLRVLNARQYEGALLYRSCCHQLNAVGDKLIQDYYKTLSRSEKQYQEQVDLNMATTKLFTSFLDSTRTTIKTSSVLLDATRKDLDSAKGDLTKALKEIKIAKWALPIVGGVAAIVGVVVGFALKKK